jgi:hypothetical protein
MRKLKSTDIFPMVGILNKIGFSDIKDMLTPEKVKDLMKAMKTKDENEDPDENENKDEDLDFSTILGFNLIFEVATIIFANLMKCKDDLYTFLSDVSEQSIKELEDLPPADFLELIIEVLQKPEFGDFFKVVSKFFN